MLGGENSDASESETGSCQGKNLQQSSRLDKGKPTISRDRNQKLFLREQQELQYANGSKKSNDQDIDHEQDEASQHAFDPFGDDFATLARSSSGADPPEFSGQRIRRATLNFGQSCVEHATNSGTSSISGKAEAIAPASVRRASVALGAGQGPAMRPPVEDDTSVVKTKIYPLEPPKHDKAVDKVLKNRRLRGVEHGPAQTSSAFKSAFSKFQN